MNETPLIASLRRHLDEGAAQLPQATLERLYQARQHALAAHRRQQTHRAPARQAWLRPALATLTLAAGIGLTAMYLHDQEELSAIAALDAALLVDDLPPRAFTDPGFRAWLEESSEG